MKKKLTSKRRKVPQNHIGYAKWINKEDEKRVERDV